MYVVVVVGNCCERKQKGEQNIGGLSTYTGMGQEKEVQQGSQADETRKCRI